MSVQLALKRFGVASATLAWLCTSSAAQGQTLGEVAKKEQERRKNLPEAAKVYTNKDLPKSAQKPAEAAAPAAAQPAGPEPSSAIPVEGQPPAAGEKAAAEEPKGADAKGEPYWKRRMAEAREELRRQEMFAQALQTRVNALTTDVLSRSDPAQKARLAGERQEATAELARVKQEIERGKKQIADIEEEARKAGAPPGWLR